MKSKHIICELLTLLLLLVITPAEAADDNYIIGQDLVVAQRDQKVKLAVELVNNDEISDLQFDIVLPEGVSISTDDEGKLMIELDGNRTTTQRHTIMSRQQADGALRVVCTSLSGDRFAGNSGNVVNVFLDIANSAPIGIFDIILKNVVVSNSSNTYKPINAISNISIRPPSHTISFIVDGNILIEDVKEVGDAITAPNAPNKEGYTFISWGNVPATMPDNDLVFNAEYSVNQYTVTYKIDGETYKEYTLDYGTGVTIPPTPQKEGHTFSGWNTKIAETMPAYDLEYTGSFITNPYKITYFVDGEEYYNANISYGAQVTPIDNPQKTGYTFSGWDNVPTTMPANDVIVTGAFSISQYSVVFKVDGKIYKILTQDYGTAIITPEAPTKEGYTFSGWQNVATTMPANDLTYEASFSVNQYTVTFKVDGEVFKTLTQDYGTAITTPEAPTKEGYSFSGWQNVASNVPAQDVTYEANFTVNQYTLKFMADGQVVREESVDYGSVITAPNAPVKTGYTFMSWGDVATTMPANDATYTAEYKVNQYKLTYMIDGRVYKTYTLDYDTVIMPEDDAEDDDYYYGWEEIPDRMPDHDVTINAYITGIAAAGVGLSNHKYEIFTIDGKKLNNLQKGINIIRLPNGKTQKVVIR